MTDHEPGDVVGIFGNKVQLQVTTDHAEQANSYTTISYRGGKQEADTATVTLEAERTFFQYEGDTFMFDGVEYRPNSDHRDDTGYMDGEVKLTYPDGFYPDEGHTLSRLTVGEFVELLVNGVLAPTPNPHADHD